jgi:hypothetical protein
MCRHCGSLASLHCSEMVQDNLFPKLYLPLVSAPYVLQFFGSTEHRKVMYGSGVCSVLCVHADFSFPAVGITVVVGPHIL